MILNSAFNKLKDARGKGKWGGDWRVKYGQGWVGWLVYIMAESKTCLYCEGKEPQRREGVRRRGRKRMRAGRRAIRRWGH